MYRVLIVLCFLLLLNSCNNKDYEIIKRPLDKNISEMKPLPPNGPVSIQRYNFTSSKDTSISIEKGGPGFERDFWRKDGWQTRTNFPVEGSSKAIKGGTFRVAIGSFPSMYRTEGKGSNESVISTCTYLLYESLLAWDREEELIPRLASHWKITNNGKTIFMRLDPRARWCDGMPVTADDVVATYNLLVDPGLLSPYTKESYEQFTVSKISKYIVCFKFYKEGWRNILNAGLWYRLYPAHHLNKLDGKTYLQKYQFTALPGTGPYIIDYDQTIKGKKFVLRRRSDYWGTVLPQNKGRYNYDKIVLKVITDIALQYETFKKGETDIYYPTSKQWIEDFNIQHPKAGLEEKLPRGIIQKRKIFAHTKKSFSGMALNMRKPPFNDIRVRKAFALLYNREQISRQLEFGETSPLDSHWPYSKYKHPANKAVPYNPKLANKLLDEAGWQQRNAEGYRIHPQYGILEVTSNIMKYAEKTQTVYQQDLQKAGIKYNLQITTWPTASKIIDERNFKLQSLSWGSASVPNLEGMFNSKLGMQNNTNNITGLNKPILDSLNILYKATFDIKKRSKIVQQVDSIAYNEYHYIFDNGVPYSSRFAYLNKFGILSTTLTYSGGGTWEYWWIDPDKEKKINKALKGDINISFPIGKTIVDPWHLKPKNYSINHNQE